MQSLSIEQITKQYPDQWVLLGDPLIENAKVASGFVIATGMDKGEIASKGINWRQRFQAAVTVFTGKPNAKKFWL